MTGMVRHVSEWEWIDLAKHHDGSLTKLLVTKESCGSQNIDFFISSYAPKAYAAMHSHEVAEEVFYFIAGEGIFMMGKTKHRIGPGSVVTHICAKSRGGKFQLQRQSMRKRMRAKLAEIKEEMRRRLHQRIAEQGQWLKSVVAGYFAYHAVPTNGRSISAFRYHVIQMWLKSLRRRSQRHNMPWERMNRIIDAWIPPAVIRHPWPNQRFDVKHPRQEPSALAAHARICAGGAA